MIRRAGAGATRTRLRAEPLVARDVIHRREPRDPRYSLQQRLRAVAHDERERGRNGEHDDVERPRGSFRDGVAHVPEASARRGHARAARARGGHAAAREHRAPRGVERGGSLGWTDVDVGVGGGAGFIRSRVSNDDARGGRSTRRASRMARARSRENRRVDESARDAPVTPPPARAARRARSEEKLEREPSSRARGGTRRARGEECDATRRPRCFFFLDAFSSFLSGSFRQKFSRVPRFVPSQSSPRRGHAPPQGWLSPGISSKR